jgi:hypothetical protein
MTLLAAAAIAVRLTDELGRWGTPATAVLIGLPTLVFGAYAHRHSRTVALTATDGALALTDWRGRRRTLRHPATVLYCTIYSGGGRLEHIVVGGPLTEIPLLLRTGQWRPGELSELWRRLGLEPRIDDLTSVPGVRWQFPGVPLPYATRHPMTFGLLLVLAAFAHITAVVSGFRAVA